MLLIGKPSISMGHLYHGYVSHNQRVSSPSAPASPKEVVRRLQPDSGRLQPSDAVGGWLGRGDFGRLKKGGFWRAKPLTMGYCHFLVIIYNWLFLRDYIYIIIYICIIIFIYRFHKWGFVSAYNWQRTIAVRVPSLMDRSRADQSWSNYQWL